jgi:hypothetical protein
MDRGGFIRPPSRTNERANVHAQRRRSGKCLVATVYADGPPSELIATIGVEVE